MAGSIRRRAPTKKAFSVPSVTRAAGSSRSPHPCRDSASFVATSNPARREQRVDVSRGMILHASEDVGEILEGVDAARLAGRDERVETRDVRAALEVVDEEVVLAAEGHAAERALRAVVVERHALVVEEDAEMLPL